VLEFDRVGQIDGRSIGMDVDGFDRLRRAIAEQNRQSGHGRSQNRAKKRPAKRSGVKLRGAQKSQ
jgi:hypothetical protein